MTELESLRARISELEELLKDRENTISVRNQEMEKKMYEIGELRGKVEAYERVIACIQSSGNVNLTSLYTLLHKLLRS